MNKLLIVMLLVGCNESISIDPFCEPAQAPTEDSSVMCSSSMVCYNNQTEEYKRHLCFCDVLCICFYSSLTISDSCSDVNDVRCKRNNTMMLFEESFCEKSRSEREEVIFSINNQMEDVNNGQ